MTQIVDTTHEGFHEFQDPSFPDQSHGSFEVFSVDPVHRDIFPETYTAEPGWYWWPCYPGCLPDGEPYGPFSSAAEAWDDAQQRS